MNKPKIIANIKIGHYESEQLEFKYLRCTNTTMWQTTPEIHKSTKNK